MKKILIIVGKLANKYNFLNNFNDISIDIKKIDESKEALKKGKIKYDLIIIDEEIVKTKKFERIKTFLINRNENFILSSYFSFENKGKLEDELYSLLGRKLSTNRQLVIIGSSTGGPKALQEIIPKIPSKLNSIVLIVQHMPAKFTESLAKRLDTVSAIAVKEVDDGELLETGTVYLAQGDQHLKIENRHNRLYAKLSNDEKHLGLRPAVDILFKSIRDIDHYEKMAVILTGMGTDGTIGLKGLNSYNIVQDEESSVIYGMPRSALNANVINKVVPLQEIALEITKRVGC